MSPAGWLAALGTGLLAGAVSGLVGIGGGAIMVPFLYFFLASSELAGVALPATEQAVIAHATSLLVIVPISVRGAWLYHRAGRVDWDAGWRMGLAAVAFAVLGARVAVAVPGQALKLVFGIFLLAVAVQVLLGRRSVAGLATVRTGTRTVRALLGGALVGFFSALLGVGGGLVAIPVLLYWLHLPMEKVSATSLAIITFTAAAGVLTYAVSGQLGGPGGAAVLSYFHLPVALALAVGALIAVPLGTEAQLRMPTRYLRYLFAVVFLLLGARLTVVNLLMLVRGP
ncbi:MAG: sulfite exporter TauE/SafE family protein [Gemmatimonadetes bacterium]|uniref:Probable membrane transporter protein n=1 Tax=Candidatus Kutchimonas denitrificans TaxID=3056748 RepID=A0AAE4Z533_9BACT|nr:sulfite exporter TauE/SafE family protein [Gemmatimonadota bacterium]NIR73944.1 sulfite exporter TauE/SafE family protein [Candidatus Kutchimonas denitrificans]NIR99750.1 sulfite exporter TauE/SafE family protein [Gemmatimonadota bacterium]NIT65335.1 sulfite exporter TauE/SafE family protein [Gemmatimonadota bacterium]NIW73784.1 TSUP family transporter [Gemmatimonadota bacterium]